MIFLALINTPGVKYKSLVTITYFFYESISTEINIHDEQKSQNNQRVTLCCIIYFPNKGNRIVCNALYITVIVGLSDLWEPVVSV